MELVITWRELLIAVVLATAVYLIETLLLSRRRGDSAAHGDEGLRRELAQLGQEVASLRQRLDALPAGGDGEEAGGPQGVHSAYDYAVQYAREGMAAQEIAERCGISRDEAALIAAMHRRGLENH